MPRFSLYRDLECPHIVVYEVMLNSKKVGFIHRHDKNHTYYGSYHTEDNKDIVIVDLTIIELKNKLGLKISIKDKIEVYKEHLLKCCRCKRFNGGNNSIST